MNRPAITTTPRPDGTAKEPAHGAVKEPSHGIGDGRLGATAATTVTDLDGDVPDPR
ncbi:hypothetical protein [Streptosporangium sp. NPDC051022]|uniref:hypothetical protein n=1 Tax=Streptosporangium sp. NPDC051022 TaxID=3155752 RepID=UPI003435573A